VIVRKLEYLVALARERHFARAAAACGVSQPTLSAGIQQLEAELGVQIVQRARRFQGFTEEGDLVLEWAQRVVSDAGRLRERLQEKEGKSAGTLRIGVLPSVIPLMSTFTVPFRKQHPLVNLRVTMHNAFEAEQALDDGVIDVGITYLDTRSNRYGRSQVLYSEEHELLIRRGSRYSGRAKVAWEDLLKLPLCLLVPNTRIFGAEESEILNEALARTPHIVTSAIWMVMDHVRNGGWATVLPRPVRVMIAGDPELEAIPLPMTGDPPSVGIVLPKTTPRSPLAEAFFDIATSGQLLRTLQNLLGSNPSPPALTPSPKKVKRGLASRKTLSLRSRRAR